jgi:hypothetical protein
MTLLPSPKPDFTFTPSRKLTTKAIAGIVVGSVFLLLAIFELIRRRRAHVIAQSRTSAPPFDGPSDHERETQQSNAYNPPLSSQLQARPVPTPGQEHRWPVATPSGPAPSVSYDDAQRRAAFATGSPAQWDPYTPLHANMSSMEQGPLGPYFDPSAETVRRQQMLAFEQAQNPHRLPTPSPAVNQTTPSFDYSAEAVRRDQDRAWESVVRSGATSQSHNPVSAASGAGSHPLPSPPGIAASPSPLAGDDREVMMRQIQKLQQQVEQLARNQAPQKGTLAPGYAL